MNKNLIMRMNKKVSTKSEKWRHAIQLELHERMNNKQIWSDCDVIWL